MMLPQVGVECGEKFEEFWLVDRERERDMQEMSSLRSLWQEGQE